MQRYLYPLLIKSMKEFRQMIMISGPRQVGKTTLAKILLKNLAEGENYFNWDIASQRVELQQQWISKNPFPDQKQVVLDEIHKYKKWKSRLKGLFDQLEKKCKIIITGSAHLDVYRKGQDSLMGRYFLYHLYPLTVGEILQRSFSFKEFKSFPLEPKSQKILEQLLRFTGFPEPYFKKDELFYRQWTINRMERIIKEDLRDLENPKLLGDIERLILLLPERIGAPLSINNLREALDVHFNSVRLWLEWLERLYFSFRILPYAFSLSRALKKESKLYLWDWGSIENEGARFENLMAVHLKKMVDFYNDTGFCLAKLYYIRNREGQEVDFLVVKNNKPFLLIETKLSDLKPSKALHYFGSRLKAEYLFQVILKPDYLKKVDVSGSLVQIVSANRFLAQFP